MARGSFEYLLHYVRRLQENNYDTLMLVSGDKGTGKSSATVTLAKRYIDRFGFICPKCGTEFFKNVFAHKRGETGNPVFYVPDYVKNDKAWIVCPISYELDLKTGEKRKVSGCGHKFLYSQRKKMKWDAQRFIAYDNSDVIKKIFTLPNYSPIICDEAVKFAASFEHAKTESKELKKLFTVIRPKRFWIFFNIPEVSWIDSKYREAMSSFWLRMIERGVGVLFEKDKGEAIEKYHMKELQKIMGTVKYFTPMDKIRRSIMKHPCYFDTFKFPELDAKTYDNYEMVRNAVNLQRQVEEMEISNRDYAKIAAWNLMNNWDRIQIAINKSKENRMTYNILTNEIMNNPLTRKRLVSDVTCRNWIRGVDDYLKSKGGAGDVFEGVSGEVLGKAIDKKQ